MQRRTLADPVLGFILIALLCGYANRSDAQLPAVRYDRLGVDLVRLESGEKLFGFVLDQKPNGNLILAMHRDWFRDSYPNLYDQHALEEREDQKRSQRVLKERIEAWIKERTDAPQLVRFLQLERNRIADDLDSDATDQTAGPAQQRSESQFVVLQFSSGQIDAVRLADAERRKVAGIAFSRRLPDVTTTPVTRLQSLLEEQGVNLNQEHVDLADRLPKTRQESQREWAARQAIFEYQMREALEYQGRGQMLIRKGDSANVGDLLAQTLGGEASSLDAALEFGADLGLPEFQRFKQVRDDEKWWKKTVEEAEREGFRGVLISRLVQSPLSESVVVDTYFLVKESPGEWFTLVHFSDKVSVQQVDPKRMEQLRNDPQVQKALELVEAMMPTAGSRLDLALRHGAATQQALESTSNRFQSYLSQHLRSLTEPIPIP